MGYGCGGAILRFRIAVIVLFLMICGDSRVSADLVGHWSLDEVSGLSAANALGQGNDFSLSGFPAGDFQWVPGHREGGLQTDGVDDYGSLPDQSILGVFPSHSTNPASDFSIALWINPVDVTGRRPLVVKQSDPERGFVMMVEDGKIVFENWPVGAISPSVLVSTSDILTDIFTHIAFTYDSSTDIATLYLDGVRDTQASGFGGPPRANSQPLNLARYFWNSFHKWHFGGTLDDVRMYNRTLTVSDVASLVSSNEPPLVNAGQDRSVRPSTYYKMEGEVVDDGLPVSPGELTVWWELLDGPVGVTFSPDAYRADPNIRFGSTGQYIFILHADDGEFTASDIVTLAIEEGPYGGGTGEPNDPYQIWTPEQFNTIGLSPMDWDKHFDLMSNLDLSQYTGEEFNLIGSKYIAKGSLGDVEIDSHSQKLYWCDASYNAIYRANLDLTGYEELFVSVDDIGFGGLVLDLVHGKMYWAEQVSGRIQRSNLDGTMVELVLDGLSTVLNWIDLDVYNQVLYWGSSASDTVYSYSLAESGSIRTILELEGELSSIAFDSTTQRLYYCDDSANTIYSLRHDGSDQTTIFTGTHARDIEIDETTGKLYWTGHHGSTIQRGNLDGTDLEVLRATENYPVYLALDTLNKQMFWTVTYGSSRSMTRGPIDGTDSSIVLPMRGFTGVFDGQGLQITNFSYTTDSSGINSVGLFSVMEDPDANVRNLSLISPRINAPQRDKVAALVGNLYAGTIDNCHMLNGDVTGKGRVGGMAGITQGSSRILNSSADGEIAGVWEVGGLVGYSYYSNIYLSSSSGSVYAEGDRCGGLAGETLRGVVYGCESDSDVQGLGVSCGGLVGHCEGTVVYSVARGNVAGNKTIGGLVGLLTGSSAHIYRSYSRGNVGAEDSFVGGLVGAHGGDYNNIIQCYSTGSVTGGNYTGGLVGNSGNDRVYDSFWDIQTSGITVSDGGEGKTTAVMQDPNVYLSSGWDFHGEAIIGSDDFWYFSEGGYPQLWWEPDPLPPIIYFTQGEGTATDPFIIMTSEQLNSIGVNPRLMGAHFALFSDIDMSGQSMRSIGLSYDPFTGVFDGAGHTIRNSDTALFNNIDGSTSLVMNLGFETGDMIRNTCLIATQLNAGTIRGCWSMNSNAPLVRLNNGVIAYCKAIDVAILEGAIPLGGVVSENNGEIYRCSASGSITADYQKAPVGGLVGKNNSSGSIYESTANCDLTGQFQTGGLVGYHQGVLKNCYSEGFVTGSGYRGGLVGERYGGAIDKCYTICVADSGQPIYGVSRSGSTQYVFWDKDVLGQPEDESTISRTTAQMRMSITYVGWGEEPIWTIDEGNDYPRLVWQNVPGSIITTMTYTQQGTGTLRDPYLIDSKTDLAGIVLSSGSADKHFQLVADIDLSEFPELPFHGIGRLEGTFDGRGHTISNFVLNSQSNDIVGFVSWLPYQDACIKNLNLSNVAIQSTNADYTAGLVGRIYQGSIRNCSVSGSVRGTDGRVGGIVARSYAGTIEGCVFEGEVRAGETIVGGIAGSLEGDGYMINCSSQATVTGTNFVGGLAGNNLGVINLCNATGSVSGTDFIGGLVGKDSGTIDNCYVTGNSSGLRYVGGLAGWNEGWIYSSFASGSVNGNSYVGGLVGYKNGVDIFDCYSLSEVTGVDHVGGLIGQNHGSDVWFSYSAGLVSGQTSVGGLVGLNYLQSSSDGYFFHCFWDRQTSGLDSSDGGTGLSTIEMMQRESFADWVCRFQWRLDDGLDYPRLIWENTPGNPISVVATFADGRGTEQEPYIIETEEQFLLIGRERCLWEKHFDLRADLDLAWQAITPIGDAETPFTGSFLGNDHRISNLQIFQFQGDYVGLFGNIVNSSINGVSLENVLIHSANNSMVGSLVGMAKDTSMDSCNVANARIIGSDYVGGFAGRLENIVLEACSVSNVQVLGRTHVGGMSGKIDNSKVNSVVVSGIVEGTGGYIGGLSGGSNRGEHSNVHVDCDIISSGNNVGGLIGRAAVVDMSDSTAKGSLRGKGNYVGGMIGYASHCTVVNGTAATEVIDPNYDYVGGFVGYSTLSDYSLCSSSNKVLGQDYVGGFSGYCGTSRVNQCLARSGSVMGRDWVGGFMGTYGNHSDDYTVQDCYSSNIVDGRNIVAGFIGQVRNKSQILRCYTASETSGEALVGGFIADGTAEVWKCYWQLGLAESTGGEGRFPSQMKQARTYHGWGCNDAWVIQEGVDTPRLSWEGTEGAILLPLPGSGTAEDPFRLETHEDFEVFTTEACLRTQEKDYHFSLECDIDWANDGTDYRSMRGFFGTLNGNGHVVSNLDHALFDSLFEAEISNLYLVDVQIFDTQAPYLGALANRAQSTILSGNHIESVSIHGGDKVGGLVGDAFRCLVYDCSGVQVEVEGIEYVGGLFGYASVSSYTSGIQLSISNTIVQCVVRGKQNVGGLIGYGYLGRIYDSYSVADVYGMTNVGGLIGKSHSFGVERCFSKAQIEGLDYVGGLIGASSYWYVVNCYSEGHVIGDNYVGGLIGSAASIIIDQCLSHTLVQGDSNTSGLLGNNSSINVSSPSFWDVQLSGQPDSEDSFGFGLRTAELQLADTYTDWRCDAVWTINEPNGYPRLWWEKQPGVPISNHDMFAGGLGQVVNPYLVATAEQLNNIDQLECYLDKHYRLIADIDFTSYVDPNGDTLFQPIGSIDTPFTGSLNGDNFTISNLAYSSSDDYVGVFRYLESGAGLKNIRLSNSFLSGNQYVGSLAGMMYSGTIQNCHVDGGEIDGWRHVGGIVGLAGSEAYNVNPSFSFENCDSNAYVTGNINVGGIVGTSDSAFGTIHRTSSNSHVSSDNSAGGIVGRMEGGIITESFANATVAGGHYVGGILGWAEGFPNLSNCYTQCDLTGTSTVGGIVGAIYTGAQLNMSRCYSASFSNNGSLDGGLTPPSSAEVDFPGTFWDIDISGVQTSKGGEPKSTLEMQTPTTFSQAGWDLVGEDDNGHDDIWSTCKGSYPRLTWEKTLGDLTCPSGVGMEDLYMLSLQWLNQTLIYDADSDGTVHYRDWVLIARAGCDVAGFKAFALEWLKKGATRPDFAPIDGDGIFNLLEFSVISQNWLEE